ncbi:MAG: hypothetical protein IT467_12490 [Dokdonella sp.]|uniref:hypothetical protein n=1 Tax=Dokdonella sp. TaxID=2291710 RepID=UPI0025BC281E|nr:hypothetical protein [Dokdonella sp.]MBZ0222896.1 hypothetical protein [Dokdonella sp.]MCC7256738.1 hypothetical protein [Dokdonella sp.]
MIRKCILATLPLLVGAVLTASPALAIQTDVVVAKPADAAAPADAAPAKKETVKKVRRHRAVVDTNSTVPVRGMSMAQVEKRFGAPVDKLPAAGGDAPRHPTINRWRYNGYTVYFERTHVIHTVMDAAAPTT